MHRNIAQENDKLFKENHVPYYDSEVTPINYPKGETYPSYNILI